jgi:hypothetical protein
MTFGQAPWRSGLALVIAGALVGALYAQRPFRQYPSVEGWESMPLPQDWRRQGEWTFARLMYPPGPLDGYRGRFNGDWRQGLSLWTQDFPKADRMLAAAVRRLTRVDARSVEQCVNLDDGDEVYNWPWLYAVQVGEWGLTEAQAKKLRDYLLRGGFFMADDFHGHEEQAYFEKTMKMVFPERPIVISRTTTQFFTLSLISTIATASRGWSTWIPVTRRTGSFRAGRAFTTIKAASWWQFR